MTKGKIITVVVFFCMAMFSAHIAVAHGSMSTLSDACIETLKPVAEELGLSMEKLDDTMHAMELKNYLVETGRWDDVHSKCAPHPTMLGSSHCCENCHCSVTECCYWAGRYCNHCRCCPG